MNRWTCPLWSLLILAVACGGGEDDSPATGPTTERVSVASDGSQGDNGSWAPSISADGRYVAFHSAASNLVGGDTNSQSDVFVHDRATGRTTRVSVASDGTEANNYSFAPSVSADGRYVAFSSLATNLVAGDTNGCPDTFVHDRVTGQTTRISVASDGAQGDNFSGEASLSADGRYVAFYAFATNLVAEDTNATYDTFVHDRVTGETARVSVASNGAQGNQGSVGLSISADGRYVAFKSTATNLVDGDTNGVEDTFVHDRQTGETSRVSVASDGTQGDKPSYIGLLSADGLSVLFVSEATNLVADDTNGTFDVFVHDRVTGQTAGASVASDGTQGNGSSGGTPSISPDGRYVAFHSSATNLIAEDTNDAYDIFIHDRVSGETTRVSVAGDGAQANGYSINITSISADGSCVAFESGASNLVEGDTNESSDVFVRAR